MEYVLDITTVTKKYVFCFKKKRYLKSYDEIVDYVDDLTSIFKKSAKVIVVVYDESDKPIAQYHYDYGWFRY